MRTCSGVRDRRPLPGHEPPSGLVSSLNHHGGVWTLGYQKKKKIKRYAIEKSSIKVAKAIFNQNYEWEV